MSPYPSHSISKEPHRFVLEFAPNDTIPAGLESTLLAAWKPIEFSSRPSDLPLHILNADLFTSLFIVVKPLSIT